MPEATTSSAVADAAQAVVEETIDKAWIEGQLGGNHVSTPAPPTEEVEETPAEPEVVEETTETQPETTEEPVEEPEVTPPTPPAATATPPKTPPAAIETKPKEEPTATVETPKDIRAERKRVNAKLAELRKQIDGKEELDPVDDGKLLKEINATLLEAAQLQDEAIDVVDQELIEPKKQEAVAEAYWDKWAKDHPEHNAELAVDAWEDCLLEAGKRYKTDDAINGFATALFESRLDGLKKTKIAKPAPAPPKPAATAPKPTVTKGAARVVPTATQPARVAQKELTPEEMLEKGMVDWGQVGRLLNK